MKLALAACAAVCLGQTSRTLVDPLPDENILNPCEYRIAMPGSSVRAVWTVFDRGADFVAWFEDRQVRAFAKQRQLALMLAMHCRSKDREDMDVDPAHGIGRALFQALDQFAVSENRSELRSAPIIAMGWSGAGSLVGRLAGFRPARYLAGIAYAPGQYEPLGMDTIELPDDAIRPPQLIIANGADNINGTERTYRYFQKYLQRDAPWTFAVQNRTPHCCLQNARALILDWLDAVLSGEEKPWRGYFRPEASSVRDEWKSPVFNAAKVRLSPRVSKPGPGEIDAGHLYNRKFADTWRAFVGRRDPIAIWKP